MNVEEIQKLDQTYYMNTFGPRTPIAFARGEGMYLYTEDGERYLDFFAGIAVSGLGHCHPVLTKALHEQVDRVLHTSSLYYIEPQARLAQEICRHSCADRVYFANSGAEANEGALKLAKIYFYKQGKTHKTEVISLQKSFHGRTLATVAATGQPKYQAPYQPLIPGFHQVPINDIDALRAAVNDNTCAILLEVAQGESGVHLCDHDYLRAVRALCDEKEIILIFDEVQTGMGRTGEWFAYQTTPIEPDIFTLAKALGGGVPIGALCAKEFVAQAFAPGDHGGTFGGNPLATTAGLAVFQAMEDEALCDRAKKMGALLVERIAALHSPRILEIRHLGLMIGLQMEKGMAKTVQQKLLERHVLVGNAGGHTLRILPPLIVSEREIEEFIKELEAALA